MTSLQYLNIPPSATRLLSSSSDVQPVPKIHSSLPSPADEPGASSEPTPPSSPLYNLFPNVLLSSVLPSGPQSNPRAKKNANVQLLSSKDPLSIAITTKIFKAFVERVGPVFWLQDRIEEVVLWKKSWKWTVLWMFSYCVLCYYPRLLLCLPQVTLIAIIVSSKSATTDGPVPSTAREGSIDWQANIQAIQNLMGFYVEAHATIQPYTLFLQTPNTPNHILTLLVLTLLPIVFITSMPSFPARQVIMFVGIFPLGMTHPNIRPFLPRLFRYIRSSEFVFHVRSTFNRVKVFSWILPHHPSTSISPKTWSSLSQLLLDNNNLSDAAWNSEMREVELFENERLDPAQASDDLASHDRKKSYTKAHLRAGERNAWTRRRDGWGPVFSVSTSTFSLAENWHFVETEDWHADLEASWSSSGGDSNGWVYTNDSWLDARPHPYHDNGVATTRRRRWVRRVWFSPE